MLVGQPQGDLIDIGSVTSSGSSTIAENAPDGPRAAAGVRWVKQAAQFAALGTSVWAVSGKAT